MIIVMTIINVPEPITVPHTVTQLVAVADKDNNSEFEIPRLSSILHWDKSQGEEWNHHKEIQILKMFIYSLKQKGSGLLIKDTNL